MLSLGIKEGIINDEVNYKVTAYTAGVPSVALDVPDKLVIEGFGTFNAAGLVAADSTVTAAIAPVNEVSDVTLTMVPATGIIYTAQFFIKTDRYQSEFANAFIKQGRPIVIQIVGDGVKTISLLIAEEVVRRDDKFNIGNATPFSAVDAAGVLTVTVDDASLHLEKVLFRAKNDVLDTSAAIAITTVGTEGQGNGSQVEESVRMGFGENVNPYGVKAGSDARINAKYTEIFWKQNVGVTEKVGFVLDEAPINRIVSFDVFMNEGTTAAAIVLVTAYVNQVALV